MQPSQVTLNCQCYSNEKLVTSEVDRTNCYHSFPCLFNMYIQTRITIFHTEQLVVNHTISTKEVIVR